MFNWPGLQIESTQQEFHYHVNRFLVLIVDEYVHGQAALDQHNGPDSNWNFLIIESRELALLAAFPENRANDFSFLFIMEFSQFT
jgi:hypothetical protein